MTCPQEFLVEVEKMMKDVSKDVSQCHAVAASLEDELNSQWLQVYIGNSTNVFILTQYLLSQGTKHTQSPIQYPGTDAPNADNVRYRLEVCNALCSSILDSMDTKQTIDNISICQLWYELQWINKFILTVVPFFLPGEEKPDALTTVHLLKDIRKAACKLRYPVTPFDLMCTEDTKASPTVPLTPIADGPPMLPESTSPKPPPPSKAAPVLRLDTSMPPPLTLSNAAGRTGSVSTRSKRLEWGDPQTSPPTSPPTAKRTCSYAPH